MRHYDSNPLQETAMTFEDLGALGDLISGFAVIASLIYLAAQIRQNTAMITAQTVQSAVDATQRVLLYRVEDSNLRAILRKARANDQLDSDELEVLVSYLQASFMNFQARLQHNARGLFDPSVNESYELILRDYLHQGYVQRWWTFAKALYGREFRNHCDAMIAEIERGGAVPVRDWQALLRPRSGAPGQ
jgi:hypothetical protein